MTLLLQNNFKQGARHYVLTAKIFQWNNECIKTFSGKVIKLLVTNYT